MKKGPLVGLFVGYIGDEISYPVMWELCHKPHEIRNPLVYQPIFSRKVSVLRLPTTQWFRKVLGFDYVGARDETLPGGWVDVGWAQMIR